MKYSDENKCSYEDIKKYIGKEAVVCAPDKAAIGIGVLTEGLIDNPFTKVALLSRVTGRIDGIVQLLAVYPKDIYSIEETDDKLTGKGGSLVQICIKGDYEVNKFLPSQQTEAMTKCIQDYGICDFPGLSD